MKTERNDIGKIYYLSAVTDTDININEFFLKKEGKIREFSGYYDFLSNFYPASVEVDSIEFLNSESAYQAYKCEKVEDRYQFCGLNPSKAKRLGQIVEVRPDWEEVKIPLMEKVVYAKFTQNPHLIKYLLETGDMELQEGNTWNDVFWGVDILTGEGENNLGKILMKLRDMFRQNDCCLNVSACEERVKYSSFDNISVQYKDITVSQCDCIVNAFNGNMSDYNGLNTAVVRAGGTDLFREIKNCNCGVSEVLLTNGYNLNAKYIIHAVAPLYGTEDDRTMLKNTYFNILDKAKENNIHCIAIPILAIGPMCFPAELAVKIAVDSIRQWKSENSEYNPEIIFTAFDINAIDIMKEYFSQTEKLLNKAKGCLIGGAVGDAFGYTVEFMSREEIGETYGKDGLRDYVLTDGTAVITDDTQMTLFTAEGIFLWEKERKEKREIKLENCCFKAYRDWFFTQEKDGENKRNHKAVTEIYSVNDLHVRRAPGFTCLDALRSKKIGKIDNPVNNSKGNGGIMRVSPVAIHFSSEKYSLEDIMLMGAKTAAVTHGHPLGFISTAMLTSMLSLMIYNNYSLSAAISKAKGYTYKLFGSYEEIGEMMSLVDKAEKLAKEDINDADAIAALGRSALAESTLAIAIYCSLKYENDFEKAIVAAVNFDGDSDTVAAVTGNIMGARLGIEAISEKFIEPLQFRNLILKTAEKLYK